MNLEHEFTVPVPVDEAWKVLLDVERVAPCMPGATLLTVDGDEFTGTVKVKVGPIQVTYKGLAKFVEKDDNAHRAVIEASGKEARGAGTAAATVTTALVSQGETTKVTVTTDLNVTGRPAQFGRGVMSEVAAKLINQFSNCLADEVSAASAPAATTSTSAAPSTSDATAAEPVPAAAPALPPTATAMTEAVPAPASPIAGAQPSTGSSGTSGGPRVIPPSTAPRRTAEAIDLLDVAGGSLAKRLLPVIGAVVVFLLIWRRRRH